MGATWDPELIHTVAMAMSDEGRALYNAKAEGPRTTHGLVFRSPVINISRDPRWDASRRSSAKTPCSPDAWPSPTCAACRATTSTTSSSPQR
jgi:beta-glucosidase